MWTLKSLMKSASENQTEKDGKWMPAKPIPYRPYLTCLREAWAVLVGKADCFMWPEKKNES